MPIQPPFSSQSRERTPSVVGRTSRRAFCAQKMAGFAVLLWGPGGGGPLHCVYYHVPDKNVGGHDVSGADVGVSLPNRPRPRTRPRLFLAHGRRGPCRATCRRADPVAELPLDSSRWSNSRNRSRSLSHGLKLSMSARGRALSISPPAAMMASASLYCGLFLSAIRSRQGSFPASRNTPARARSARCP